VEHNTEIVPAITNRDSTAQHSAAKLLCYAQAGLKAECVEIVLGNEAHGWQSGTICWEGCKARLSVKTCAGTAQHTRHGNHVGLNQSPGRPQAVSSSLRHKLSNTAADAPLPCTALQAGIHLFSCQPQSSPWRPLATQRCRKPHPLTQAWPALLCCFCCCQAPGAPAAADTAVPLTLPGPVLTRGC
jgi:hypothetical protein